MAQPSRRRGSEIAKNRWIAKAAATRTGPIRCQTRPGSQRDISGTSTQEKTAQAMLINRTMARTAFRVSCTWHLHPPHHGGLGSKWRQYAAATQGPCGAASAAGPCRTCEQLSESFCSCPQVFRSCSRWCGSTGGWNLGVAANRGAGCGKQKGNRPRFGAAAWRRFGMGAAGFIRRACGG